MTPARPITSISIELPLPPRALHPNARAHHMVRARAAKKYRATVYWLALGTMQEAGLDRPAWMAATLQLEYVFAAPRRRDDDNLNAWFKAGRDALADAGLVANDSAFVQLPAASTVDQAAAAVWGVAGVKGWAGGGGMVRANVVRAITPTGTTRKEASA